jgi:molybdopterin synthase sulfur carrier subunit
MARILLLGPAREAAGLRDDVFEADSVGDLLAQAVARYGSEFEAVLAVSRVWVNGEGADPQDVIGTDDEVAVLPPVSGG